MTSLPRLTLTTVLSAAVIVLTAGGCASSSSSSSRTASSATERHSTPLMSELEALLRESAADDTTFASRDEGFAPYRARTEPKPAPFTHATDEGANVAGSDRFTSLIGLYGELVGDSEIPSGPHGRGNLSQISFAHDGACFDPAISPDGERIAFASTMHSANANIYIKSVAGTSVTQVTSGSYDHVMPAFSPEGDRIAYASNRDGKWDIYVAPVSGGPAVQLTRDRDHEIHPTFSPDGRKIAYSRYSSKSGRWEIWVTEIDNPGVKRFLDYGMFPRWSPDVASSKILFQRPTQRGSRLHGIWTIDYVNGEAINPTQIISAGNAAVINPTWSPDGRYIAFATVLDPDETPGPRPEQSDIWVIRADGSGRIRLTDGQFANFQPMWSSDGHVYFVSNRSGVDNIWAVGTSRLVELRTPKQPDLAGVDTESGRQ